MRRRILPVCLAAVLLTALGACTQKDMPYGTDAIQEEPGMRQESALPGFLPELLDVDNVLECEAELIREDLRIRHGLAPIYLHGYLRCLQDLELGDYREDAPELPVRSPFLLRLSYRGSDMEIAFAKEGVRISGALYTPGNPEALRELYEADDYRLLTGDWRTMSELMEFTPEQVRAVTLLSRENYIDGYTRVEIADPGLIRQVVEALGRSVFRQFESDEEKGLFLRTGGGDRSCTLTLEDGEWTLEHGGVTTVTTDGSQQQVLEGEIDVAGIFGLLGSEGPAPVLSVELGDASPQVTLREYGLEGLQKEMSFLVPAQVLFETEEVVSPGEGDTVPCALTFRDSGGQALEAQSLQVAVYSENDLEKVTELSAEEGMLLPGGEGRYYVNVHAQFGQDWANYLFAYRASYLPRYFGSIEFGNNEGGVNVTRDDAGVTIPGGQNRQYVQLITGLGLVPGRSEEVLPVKAPFTLVFEGESRDVFTFRAEGITFNGADFRPENPQALAELYLPFDPEQGEGPADHSLRGFLSKEVADLPRALSIRTEDVRSLSVRVEEPEGYGQYDVTDLLERGEIGLEGIVLAREWDPGDYYFPRRFFLSWQLTLADGSVCDVGETVTRDGEETGWFTVYSRDLPEIRDFLAGRQREDHTRENPLPGGYSVDEDGVVTFS